MNLRSYQPTRHLSQSTQKPEFIVHMADVRTKLTNSINKILYSCVLWPAQLMHCEIVGYQPGTFTQKKTNIHPCRRSRDALLSNVAGERCYCMH